MLKAANLRLDQIGTWFGKWNQSLLCVNAKQKINRGINKKKVWRKGQKEDKVTTKRQAEAKGIAKIKIRKSHKSLFVEFTVKNDTSFSIKKWPAQRAVHYSLHLFHLKRIPC